MAVNDSMPALPEGFPKYFAEFLGTYFLVLTVGCNVLGGTGVWAVTSIALSLMIGIYAFGACSGAHFNPAVTFAVFLTGKLPGGVQEALFYATSQIFGGILASFTYMYLFSASFDLAPGKGHGPVAAGVSELLYTCLLCFVILNVACTAASAGNQYFGLAIGFVIIAGGYAVGAISGAAFNPAVAIAIDLSSADKSFGMCGIYVVAELVGAALAVFLFKAIRPEEFGDTGSKNSLQVRLISEAIGAYFLTLTVGLNTLKTSAAAAWSIGACLLSLVYAMGNVSGGHFNPAVTASVLLSRRNKIDQKEAGYYVLAQLAGGVLGGISYMLLIGQSFPLNAGISWTKTGIAEILFTSLLCLVVLSVATTSKPSKDMYGLAIGSAVTAGGFAGSAFGVTLNPAVAVGVDVANGLKGGSVGHSLLFGSMELAGAGLAAGCFQALYPDEFREGKYGK